MEKLISLVVPVYFEEECIQQFIDETTTELNLHKIRYEIVFIDDGSEDKTVSIINKNILSNSNIRLIEFSYNQGKQSAVSAGIQYSKGDFIIYMDPDLQDPPKEIINFINKINEGYDLVFGVRKEKIDTWTNKLFSKIFWTTLNKFTGLNIPKGLAVMRIFNREFANEFLQYNEQNRFIEGIFMKIRKEYTTIEIEQRERFAGTSKFNFKRKMKLAFDAIFDFSEIPLKATVRFGLFMIVLGLISIFAILFSKLFILDFQAGWPSLFSLIIFTVGIQLFFLGIIAKYIGNIYTEVKRRPLYSIKRKNNIDE